MWSKRIYTPYFSVQVVYLVIALCLGLFSFSPLAEIPVQQAVNGDLVTSARYLAMVSLILGFRANNDVLKTAHLVVAILLGIAPTLFVFMIVFLMLLVGWFTVLSLVLAFDWGHFQDALALVFMLAGFMTTSVVIWTLIKRKVFAQYKYPYDLEAESKLSAVVVLLILLGGLGVHRFFVGRWPSGFAYLFTFGFLGFGLLYDAILLFCGRFKDADGVFI